MPWQRQGGQRLRYRPAVTGVGARAARRQAVKPATLLLRPCTVATGVPARDTQMIDAASGWAARALCRVLIGVVLASAPSCGDSHGPTQPPAPPTFDSAACPTVSPPALQNARCGFLVVPENRTKANRRTIRLAVAIVPSVSRTPAPDPVVYLSGGPGGSAIRTAPTSPSANCSTCTAASTTILRTPISGRRLMATGPSSGRRTNCWRSHSATTVSSSPWG